MSKYAEARSAEGGGSLPLKVRLQEVHYNMGRAFHEAGLRHLAAQMYSKALALADEPEVLDCGVNVTAEAAHNLVLIYRQSGARALAIEVMRKHLSFGATLVYSAQHIQ